VQMDGFGGTAKPNMLAYQFFQNGKSPNGPRSSARAIKAHGLVRPSPQANGNFLVAPIVQFHVNVRHRPF